MSVGPSTSGFGFVLCKAFFQQLADERADVHPGGSHRPSSSGSDSLADEDGGVHLRQGDFLIIASARIPATIGRSHTSLTWDSRMRTLTLVMEASGTDFDEFFRREYPRLLSTMFLACGDRVETEDLAQTAMVRALERWETVSAAASPAAYGYQIAFNANRSRLRRIAVALRHRTQLAEPLDPAELAVERADTLRALRLLRLGHRPSDITSDRKPPSPAARVVLALGSPGWIPHDAAAHLVERAPEPPELLHPPRQATARTIRRCIPYLVCVPSIQYFTN